MVEMYLYEQLYVLPNIQTRTKLGLRKPVSPIDCPNLGLWVSFDSSSLLCHALAVETQPSTSRLIRPLVLSLISVCLVYSKDESLSIWVR